ncbi:hypothetical protein MACJ_001246 [Theileria orientalis]|uniref:Uncharacterized protein n=1 Tax=Theileria orientalis TaxID=68886 RepID=A0A976M873_THEOR|nr:hypothetical protein MACJ_001246 [Theileria orientalis]
MQLLNTPDFQIQTNSDVFKLLNTGENEELLTQFEDVTLVFNEANNGDGKLYLTNIRLLWLNNQPSSTSYSFPYKSMMFHALSRDLNLFRRPCVLIQLNLTNQEEDNHSVLLSPTDSTLLELLFDQISKFSTLVDPPVEDDSNCEVYEEPDHYQ